MVCTHIQNVTTQRVSKLDRMRLIRFYAALALNDVLQELPATTVCQKYDGVGGMWVVNF